MRAKLRQNAVRIGLAALLVFLALVPVMYPYLASMLHLEPAYREAVGPLDFSMASNIAVSPTALMAYASIALQSVLQGNYTEARGTLGMIGKLPPNIEHNLITYITLVQELVSILNSSRSGLDELRDLVADGNITSARPKMQEVEGLLADASRRLDLLFSALERIRAIYGIDTSRQRLDLEACSRIVRGFEQALTELKALLEALDLRAATQMDLLASPSPVRIEGTLQISGQLRNGGIGLPGRVVDLWVNGVNITRLALDQYGRFDWLHDVSSVMHLDRIEVYARYTPVGGDLAKFRPAKSSTVIVPVDYYPVALSLITFPDRLHVLENFTIQGKLMDASGRALSGEVVELLIDDKTVNSSHTDTTGVCSMVTSFPLATPEGEHQLYARFEPKQGIYARASSQNVGIQLYYLKPTITLVSRELLAVSGQTVQLEGRLEIDSKPLPRGLVIAFLGGHELSRAVSEASGIFKIVVGVPFDAAGDNTLRFVFVPESPWITGTMATAVLRVLNSAMIGLGIGATMFAGVMLSGRSLDLRPTLERRFARRPRRRDAEAKQVIPTEKLEEEKALAPPATLRLSELRKIEEARLCVRETYWEVRRLLGEVLHDSGRLSETHREYEARVAQRLGDAASPFSRLTRLLEVAEYSQHALSRLEAEEGINHAILVDEAMNAEIRT